MLTIEDFTVPKDHPWQMLEHDNRVRQTFEAESLLAYILKESLTNGSAVTGRVKTKHRHDKLVEFGYLDGNYEDGYCLTLVSVGLLHKYYGKKN